MGIKFRVENNKCNFGKNARTGIRLQKREINNLGEDKDMELTRNFLNQKCRNFQILNNTTKE